MTVNTACQPMGTGIFGTENRRRCEKYVRLMQMRLDKAVADNDKEKIRWYVHLLSKRSRAVKILAIYHVTIQNQGKHTPGIDGMRMVKDAKERNNRVRHILLETIDIKKKPSPIRRILIPKPNGKQRPLGIPTMADRVIQDTLRMTLEPITEYHASENSYGFRPQRNCHDAIEHLFAKLSKLSSKQWVIEGDIKGCFDHISHAHIGDTLKAWHVPDSTVKIIRKMLKAKVLSDGELHEAEEGTPQGGILSPMLSNVVLTALDNYCKEQFGYQQNGIVINPIVRYADDFVIVCDTEPEAQDIKEKVAEYLRSNIGLELSREKTRITHISDGFDFLGFNIRKYVKRSPKSKYHEVGQLLIKPQKDKVIGFLRRVKATLDSSKTAKAETVIRLLNPMLQGFGMYYRHAVSQEAYSYIDNAVWEKLWNWSKRRHPHKPKKWIKKKYFTTEWAFKAKTGEKTLSMARIPIERYTKVKSGMRVHASDGQTREYWKHRGYRRALSQIYSKRMGRLYKRQKGKCLVCRHPITRRDISESKVQIHHIIPRAKGGAKRPNNLRLLHLDCHKQVHSVSSGNSVNLVI